MKKQLSLILVLVLLVSLLAGCGGKAMTETASGILGSTSNGSNPEMDGMLKDEGGSAAGSSGTALPENQKMVRKVWLEAETEDLDTLLAGVEEQIAALSGYVESQDQRNGSKYSGRRYRYASLTVRIPADQLDLFVQHMSGSSNIVSKKQTAENITLSYVATQSRITALETEQTRLLELLSKAESMSDILDIEKRLTDLRTELEEVTSQLRVFDNQVDYGTVYLDISEVTEFTEVEEPETVWERIAKGFSENLKGLGNFFVELFVFVVVALPYLIPLALIATGLILWLRRKRSKKNDTKETDH